MAWNSKRLIRLPPTQAPTQGHTVVMKLNFLYFSVYLQKMLPEILKNLLNYPSGLFIPSGLALCTFLPKWARFYVIA